MHYNIIKTAAGARTRLRLPMLWKADAVAAEELPEAVFWVFIGGERVRVEKTPGSDDEYIFPELQAGQYAWDLVVDAQVVLHGMLKVRGSAVPPGGGEVCGTLLVDAPAMVLVLSPGPRGEVGPVGPQGLSAYEVALQHGYEGSEDEWAEELSGAQAAATESKRQAGLSASSAAAAANSATAAQQSATAAGNSASDSAQSATAAASSATTAKEQATAAGNSATAAASSAGAAGEQATAASNSATAAAASADTAGKQATAAADSAKAAASSAGAAGEQATAAANSATAAAGSATTSGEQATAATNSASAAASSATAAAQSAAYAASTLAGAAQVDANNVFTETNTFSGALVANSSLMYKQQELNNLLTYPIAAQLMDAGINPASALASTWGEWVSMNPNWKSLDDLLFFAPLITGDVGSDLPANVNSPFKSCTFISPAQARTIPSAYMFGRQVKYFTWRGGTNNEVFDCYYVVDCDFYAPNATTLGTALNAIGYSNPGTLLSLHVYIPSVTSISTAVHGSGSTFWRIGLLKEFSIYAPKLVKSFAFSRNTASNIGQTCAILQALIDGIGTPGTTQTITTLTPSDGTDETIAALRTSAAAKNWKFILPDGTDL